jgi:hypothetical protein
VLGAVMGAFVRTVSVVFRAHDEGWRRYPLKVTSPPVFSILGISFTAQAPSELFAIGAPTSRLVVPLFSLSSTFS